MIKGFQMKDRSESACQLRDNRYCINQNLIIMKEIENINTLYDYHRSTSKVRRDIIKNHQHSGSIHTSPNFGPSTVTMFGPGCTTFHYYRAAFMKISY